ncbi:11509_t:CDS:2 [Entrophospora sp. SA101]|nr:11236_t:CDS:2 [Entrophospora sp. SA101]CAJ0904132.1 11509_t:CDS:2 [Entrophospora sp. SA101]
MSSGRLKDYLNFAVSLARESGKIILEASKARYSTQSKVYSKAGNSADLVTETDRQVEDFIKSRINKTFPEHKFIAEEMTSTNNKYEFTSKPTWIIDPIDGTTNFVHGFPFVAVSIGLTINKEPVVGVVFNPFLNELYTASKGDAATLNSKKGGLVRSIRSLECASLNICTVAKGHFDVYWEIGSSIVILQEAGGIMVNGQGPDEGPDNILGHKFLAIRGGLPCSSDENSRQSQIHLVREMWGLVEEIDCPRY